MSAFANRPGGGTIILGLDEAAGSTTVTLPDRRTMKAALASKARNALEPPVTLEIDESTVDGEPVIVAVVQELDPSQKPCRVGGGTRRGVWIRAWDGELQGVSSLRSKGFSPPEDNPASTPPRSTARAAAPILTRRSSTTLSVLLAEDRNSSPKSATARNSSGGWG